ncbi:hypothetical protein [Humidesulfovibrio sp.]|jgi:hypothetical protein|uniref:hypothetical protein n=1 Tax=Humidesulfovibrio sp. TaxID=2910988 RepID=UPI002736C05A|nr:hypothetical protein [Humidesulfovibrio sp.]
MKIRAHGFPHIRALPDFSDNFQEDLPPLPEHKDNHLKTKYNYLHVPFGTQVAKSDEFI